MGLFGWFRQRPKVETRPDLVWVTPERKYAGLADEAVRCREEDLLVIVSAHFPATLAELYRTLRTRGVECEFNTEPLDQRRLVREAEDESRPRVQLILADALRDPDAQNQNPDRSRCVSVLMGERHPLPEADEALEAWGSIVPYRCRIGYHLSLEDPLIRAFTNDWVRRILDLLGMDENEPISGEMISKHLRRAQQKIVQQATSDQSAHSAEDWFRLNCPGVLK